MRKWLLTLLVLACGPAWAGVTVVEQSVEQRDRLILSEVPRIPRDVLLRIKLHAQLEHPGRPSTQITVIWEGIEAYLALQHVPGSPEKERAAELYPDDFPKQLYLAERPFWR